MRNFFVFDGEKSLDYGVYITGSGTYDSPERAVDTYSIAGRNGDIIIDRGRFNNITLKYPAGAFGPDRHDFGNKVSAFRNMLASRGRTYRRLQDTYHPEEYRLAYFKPGLRVSPDSHRRAGEFDIEFECKPQRFLISGEEERAPDRGMVLINPTPFESMPLIHVTGYGTVTVGSYEIRIPGPLEYDIYIDSENMEAYSISGSTLISRNSLINSDGFPHLVPGDNLITYSLTINSFSIKPNWWIV